MNTSNNFEQSAAQQRTRRVRAGEPVQADAMALPTRRVTPATVQPYSPDHAFDWVPESAWRVYLSDLACALLICIAVMSVAALAVAVATL